MKFVIRVGKDYAQLKDGLWTLWSDPSRATTWETEADALEAQTTAPAGICWPGWVREMEAKG